MRIGAAVDIITMTTPMIVTEGALMTGSECV